MITPSFALTATERVLPKLALDFTTASLDPRVTLTRALNTATCVNSSGNLAVVNANLPRFDYNPVTLACNGLLIEESRINIGQYTESFNSSPWTGVGNGLTANATTSPYGTVNASKLYEDNSTGFHGVYFTIAVSAVAYSVSIYAKKDTRTRFYMRDTTHTGAYASFDVNTGTVLGAGSGGAGSIANAGNGWYRCTLTFTALAATINMAIYLLPNSGGFTPGAGSYTGDGSSGLFIDCFQFETGAFPTSYIPNTSSGTVTRNADVATMTGTNFSSWWTATTGATSVWIIPKAIAGVNPIIQFDDTTSNNIINLRGNVANPELYVKATTDQVQIDAGTIVANTAYKLTGAWNTDNCAAAQNGAAAVTDASATIPTVTQARIGSDGTNYANAQIQKIMYWPQRITNNEVQAFSK